MASADGLKVAAETLRRWMLAEGLCTTWAQLGKQETIWAVADALRAWIERYGVPLALYVDGKNLYQRPATPGERLRGEEPITQFGRMCAKLGIELIAASSPQAKGRDQGQNLKRKRGHF